jgi:hypothetical protein
LYKLIELNVKLLIVNLIFFINLNQDRLKEVLKMEVERDILNKLQTCLALSSSITDDAMNFYNQYRSKQKSLLVFNIQIYSNLQTNFLFLDYFLFIQFFIIFVRKQNPN